MFCCPTFHSSSLCCSQGFLDFPDLICEMTSLRQLLMEQNSMWFLPQTFNQLESLEVLALNANNFEMMPRVLCDMDRLVDVRSKVSV